jgi:hypothetical protein
MDASFPEILFILHSHDSCRPSGDCGGSRDRTRDCCVTAWFPFNTVTDAKLDADPKYVVDGKFRHPHRSSGPTYVDDAFFRPTSVDDGIFRRQHRPALCHAWLFYNSESACGVISK